MDIGFLEEFLVVAQEGKLGEAAERLFTTSSSLSKHIHAMEEEYGVLLFERSRKAMILNDYGQALLPYAEKIVQMQAEAQKELQDKAVYAQNVLSISTEYRVFEEAIEFRKKHHISVLINENGESVDFLKNGVCELAFRINLENEKGELVSIPYRRDRLVMICHKSHPLAKCKQMNLADLKNEEFVLFPDTQEGIICKLITGACRKAGFVPKIVFTATTGNNIVNYVAQNIGISLLWEKALTPIMRDEITTVEVYPQTELEVFLCYLKDKKLSDAARAFTRFIEGKRDMEF